MRDSNETDDDNSCNNYHLFLFGINDHGHASNSINGKYDDTEKFINSG